MLPEYLQNDKKIKTLTDTGELVEDAVHAATVEQNSGQPWVVESRAAKDPSVFTMTEKAPTRAFSWLKAPTSAFTFHI